MKKKIGRFFRTLVHPVKPLVKVADQFLVFSGIFIKKKYEEIDIIFQEIRNQIIRMLFFSSSSNICPFLSFR